MLRRNDPSREQAGTQYRPHTSPVRQVRGNRAIPVPGRDRTQRHRGLTETAKARRPPPTQPQDRHQSRSRQDRQDRLTTSQVADADLKSRTAQAMRTLLPTFQQINRQLTQMPDPVPGRKNPGFPDRKPNRRQRYEKRRPTDTGRRNRRSKRLGCDTTRSTEFCSRPSPSLRASPAPPTT